MSKAKEAVSDLYSHQDQQLAMHWLDELAADLTVGIRPPEVRSLRRTLTRWRAEIASWHDCQFSNGPTETMNNFIKRIKRVAFGFKKFHNYRVAHCFMQASPTGRCSQPSHPAESRRAQLAASEIRSIMHSLKASTPSTRPN